MSPRDDEIDFDYEERPEGAEWCDRCQGLGMAECYCGGDQCYCENNGEMECPTCDGQGWWVPTPAQLAARAETARWWREMNARVARDRDVSEAEDAKQSGAAEPEGSQPGPKASPE